MSKIDDYKIQAYIGTNTFKAIDRKSQKEVVIEFFDTQESEIGLYWRNLNFISNPIKGLINFISGRRGLSTDPKPYFQYSIPIHDGKTEVKSFDGTYFVTPFMKNGSIDKIIFKYLRSRGANHEKMNPTIRSKIIFGVASTLKRFKSLDFIQ